MDFITTNTKKKVIINPATFSDASELKKETMKCLSNAQILKDLDLGAWATIETSKLFAAISELVISIDSSSAFENAVFKCLERCSCDNIAITRQLFDDIPDLRADYYEIIVKCCEVNLRPFFKSLSTELTNRLQTINVDTPEQQ